jgi:hypothetical protein
MTPPGGRLRPRARAAAWVRRNAYTARPCAIHHAHGQRLLVEIQLVQLDIAEEEGARAADAASRKRREGVTPSTPAGATMPARSAVA